MAADLRLIGALLPVLMLAACESRNRPTPSPGAPTGDTITGRERIGWDQQAATSSELSTLRYAIYVDGTRFEMTEVTCTPTAGASGFPCSGRLPALSPGVHLLEIAAFTTAGGTVEGPRSAPLRVTVAGATSNATAPPLQDGERVTTSDRVSLTAERLAEGLDEPNDIAVAADGRVFIAESSGRVRVLTSGDLSDALHVDETSRSGGILSVALAPDFERSSQVFTLQAVAAEAGGPAFRLARYTLQRGQLVSRMIVQRDVTASSSPSGSLRFGPDRKLYVALDDGGDPGLAERASEWNGKILRLEPDGRTPDDQPAASPVFWGGLRSPAGLGWNGDGSLLWLADLGGDGVERLRAVGMSGDRPRRTGQRATYVLPRPLGAGTMTAFTDARLPEFSGNLFIAARDGGYLLRVVFEDSDRTRALRTERLLEGRVDSVRAVTVADGALYFATSDALWRLTSALPQRPGSR